MAEDWSREEVAAIVADYFAMRGHELRGESYTKRTQSAPATIPFEALCWCHRVQASEHQRDSD